MTSAARDDPADPAGDPDATEVSPGTAALEAGKTPVGLAAVSLVGIVLALVLLAAGVVAVHDVVIATGLASGPRWIDETVDGADGLTAALWVVPVACGLVLVGLAMLISALWRRRRPFVALRSQTGVYLRVKDLTTLAEETAADVDGVADVSARARRRKVGVKVTSTGREHVELTVRAAVEDALAVLASPPKVKVAVSSSGDS